MAETVITKENLIDEVINCDIPVLVDFWAEWCGPCAMLAPILHEFAIENEGKIKIGKVDVDNQEELAFMFSVNAIPTLIAFRDGEVIKKTVGLKTKEELAALFE